MDWNGFVEANEEDEIGMEDDYEEDGYIEEGNEPAVEDISADVFEKDNTLHMDNDEHIYGVEKNISDDELSNNEAVQQLNMMGRDTKVSSIYSSDEKVQSNWRAKKTDNSMDLLREQVSTDQHKSPSNKKPGMRKLVFATKRQLGRIDPLKFGAYDIVPELPSQQCTLPNGRRIFFPIQNLNDTPNQSSSSIQLLNVPIAELVHQVDLERLKGDETPLARQGSHNTNFTTNATIGSQEEEEDNDNQNKENRVDDRGSGKAVEHQLWVEKYAPQRFSDLLSPENINRGVLNAIKSWDAFVFQGSLEASRSYEAKAASQFSHFQNKDKETPSSSSEEGPVDKRPKFKVVLLCGPPGLGKTTLAHVVAKHAGYKPMEVNASDDRSVTALRERLVRALESKSVFGDKRPNLVILDEIDGADAKGSIAAVVEVIKAPLRKQAGKGKQPLTRPLICICNDLYAPHLRPLREVSLVYNFTNPSQTRLLTRLKVISKLEAVSGSLVVLVGGLSDMSASALQALCHATNNDTRSSINTLQFVSMRYKKSLQTHHASSSALLLRTLESGLKDEKKDVFDVFTSIFWRKFSTQKQSASLHRKERASSSSSSSSSSSAVDSREILSGPQYAMLSAAMYGEHDQIANGIHENFLKIPFIDPTFSKVCEVTDWLCWQSRLQRKVNEEQLWFLLAYIPAVAAATHSLAAVDFKPQFTMPKQSFQFQQVSIQRNDIVCSFMGGIEVRQCNGSKNDVVLDLIPQLLTILSPNIRAISSDLFSAEEKKSISHMIDTLQAFGLSYSQTFGDKHGTQGAFSLTPELDLLVLYEKSTDQFQNFKNSQKSSANSQNNKKPKLVSNWSEISSLKHVTRTFGRVPGTAPLIPNFLRMIVARDVEIAKYRKAAAAASEYAIASPLKKHKPSSSLSAPRRSNEKSPAKPPESLSSDLLNHEKSMKTTKTIGKNFSKKKRDFFGREIIEEHDNKKDVKLRSTRKLIHECSGYNNEEEEDSVMMVSDDELEVKVKYSFQKGFTNAIKRPVFLTDLM